MLEADGETAPAIEVLERVLQVQPLDAELHRQLGELLLAANRPADALDEFQVVLARGAYDKANAYFQIARAYDALGDSEATRENLLMALDVAPGFRDAQRLLLDVMRNDPSSNQQGVQQ